MMRRPLRRTPSQAGFTMVETLIGVSILGIGVVAVVGGMATSIKTADIGRSSAEANLAVQAYAEALATATYVDCAATYATGYSAPAGYTAEANSVAFWNMGSSSFGPACVTDGLQRVTLIVTSDDDRAEAKLLVAKRTRPEDAP